MITRNVIHNIFDFVDSSDEASSSPFVSRSGTFCSFLRGTITFPPLFFSFPTPFGAIFLLSLLMSNELPSISTSISKLVDQNGDQIMMTTFRGRSALSLFRLLNYRPHPSLDQPNTLGLTAKCKKWQMIVQQLLPARFGTDERRFVQRSRLFVQRKGEGDVDVG